MNKFNFFVVPVLSTLVSLAAACVAPEATDSFGEESAGLEDIAFRPFCDFPCRGGGNSPIVGAVDISTWPQVFGEWVTNPSTGDAMVINAARVEDQGNTQYALEWDVKPDGELQFTYNTMGGPVVVGGINVKNAEFDVYIDPDTEAGYYATLKILEVDCTATPVCQYLMVSDHQPLDVDDYQKYVIGSSIYYSTCPMDSNGGTLTGDAVYHTVFASNTEVDVLKPNPVQLASNRDSMLCVNGAASKGMWQHEVFFDWKFEPHPRALDGDAQNNALVNAYRAFYNDDYYTTMGQKIWLEDLDNDLFDIDAIPPEATLEGYYGLSGQRCRAPDNGHRYIHGANIPNYHALPVCGNPGVDDHIEVWAVSASKI